VNGYLNLGLAWFKLGDDKKAILHWKIAEHYYPNNPHLRHYYTVYSQQLKSKADKAFIAGDYTNAVKYYSFWSIITPGESQSWSHLAGAQFNIGNRRGALRSINNALKIEPGHADYLAVKKSILEAGN
jgi:tetratricopeptide (TPR) repeat protein